MSLHDLRLRTGLPTRMGPACEDHLVRIRAASGRWTRLAVALLMLVLGVFAAGCSSNGNGTATSSTPAAASNSGAAGPFGGSPAADWQPAAVALVMPAARSAGPFTMSEVAGALSRARAYLLTARTNSTVLARHDTSALQRLVDPHVLSSSSSGQPLQVKLAATFLAPGNALAAPVRLKGTVTDRYVPTSGNVAERFVVSANVVWAYALRASYPVAPIPSSVVAIHERIQLSFYLSADMSGPSAKPDPSSDQTLWYDVDCGYFNQSILALPRIDDPDALPASNTGAGPDTAFDPNSDVNGSTHACKPK